MEPSEILESTIDILRKALDKMDESEWEEQTKKLSPEERENAFLSKTACYFAEVALVSATLENIRDKLKENDKELTDGTDRVNKALKNLKQVKNVLDAVNSLLSVVAKVVAVAAAPSAIPAVSLLKETAAFGPRMFLNEESKAMPEEFLAEEKTAFVPIEEVLYKVELTPAKLIITVDAGWNRSVEVVFRNKLNC